MESIYTYEDICKMDDDKAIAIIRQGGAGSEPVSEYFMKKYKELVLRRARRLYLVGGEKEDLIQEGMIGLYKAIREYDSSKNIEFSVFADKIIYRQMCNTIVAYNRKKNNPLNEYVSLYQTVAPADSEGSREIELIDTMEAPVNSNPEDFYIDKENADMIEFELVRRLSKLEKSVYELYVSGSDYKQIALKLQKSPKTVDNTIQRIKNKCLIVIRELHN